MTVLTFSEGEEVGSRTKQWVITPNDNQPIAIAVICEQWVNGSDALDTFVQVTVPANKLISRITDRMPATLPREDWPAWLGETNSTLSEVKVLPPRSRLAVTASAAASGHAEPPTKAPSQGTANGAR
ncbi:MAG: SOS response-associated peptidase family protein [Hyphomicrobiaceae bacterium]